MAAWGVLVLEPDRVAQSRFRQALRTLRFAPVVSTSLSDALDRAEAEPFAAIIANIDALLPGGRSAAADAVVSELRTAIERLRASQRRGTETRGALRPPPIIVTGNEEGRAARIADHQAALRAGADLYLSRPEAATAEIIGALLRRLTRTRDEDRPERGGRAPGVPKGSPVGVVGGSTVGSMAAKTVREAPGGRGWGVGAAGSRAPTAARATARRGAATRVTAPPAEAGRVDAQRLVADVFALPTADLRSERGRLDAQRIADTLGVPLAELATALGVAYRTVHKTPDSEALQPRLAPFANVLAMLSDVFVGDRRRIRGWLREARSEFDGRAPLDALLTPGKAPAIEQFVARAWMGEPE
jgi:CheY-like chemotaxis protein